VCGFSGFVVGGGVFRFMLVRMTLMCVLMTTLVCAGGGKGDKGAGGAGGAGAQGKDKSPSKGVGRGGKR